MKSSPTKLTSKTTKVKQGDDATVITEKLLTHAVLMPPVAQFSSAKEYFDYFYHHKKNAGKKSAAKKTIALPLEPEVVSWFKQHHKNYQASINHVLKHYILSHELPR